MNVKTEATVTFTVEMSWDEARELHEHMNESGLLLTPSLLVLWQRLDTELFPRIGG